MWWEGKAVRNFPRTFPSGNIAENYGKNAGNSVLGTDAPPMSPDLAADAELLANEDYLL
jgi:hypothetical protein